MLKKIGKGILIILSIFGLLFVALVGYEIMKEESEAEASASDSAQPTAPVLYHYSVAEMKAWLEELAQEGAKTGSRCFSMEDCDVESFRSELGKCINELYAQDLFFAYCVDNVEYTTWNYEEYIQTDVRIDYTDHELSFEQLPRAESKKELFTLLQDSLKDGDTDFVFLLRKPVSNDDISQIVKELCANSVENAAECSSYNSYLTPDSSEDGYALVSITLNYQADSERLAEATSQMRARLDAMAAELQASGLEGQELYRAAARAIMDCTEYDDDTRIASYRDDLSDEQKFMRSAYGAVVSGKTVCSGYAMAYKALCDRLDLPCWVINGYVDDGYHAWNIIELSGETYHTDCTFADSAGDESYLFMDEQRLEKEHYYYSVTQIIPWAS